MMASMSRLKYLAQSLLLPLLQALLLGAVFFVQLMFFSTTVATVWVEVEGHDLASIEERLQKLEFKTSVVRSSELREALPDTCSEDSFRIEVSGNRGLDSDALMGAIEGEGSDSYVLCSGLVFRSVAPQFATATDWITLVLLGVSSLFVGLAYMAGRAWLPHIENDSSLSKKILLGLGAAAAIIGANIFFLGSGLFPSGQHVEPGVLLPEQVIFFVILTVLIAPFVEELAFRAWMIPIASKAVGAPVAALFSTLVFSASHFPSDVYEWMFYLVAGGALSLLWLRTRSLATCVLAHAAANASTFLPY